MRALEVLPKAGLYSLALQCTLVCVAFLIRENESDVGAKLILTSWVPGLAAFFLGMVTAFKARRMAWLGLPVAAFLVWCVSVFFFLGIGL